MFLEDVGKNVLSMTTLSFPIRFIIQLFSGYVELTEL